MTEYTLTHFHVGKYKKKVKLNAQMTKELQKATKAKPKELKLKLTNEKVVFQNKKDELILANIEKMRKSTDEMVVVAATKLGSNPPGRIFAMRFSNLEALKEFFDIVDRKSRGEEVKKPTPKDSVPTSTPAASEKQTRTPSRMPSASRQSSSEMSSTTLPSNLTTTIDDGLSSTTNPQKGKRSSVSQSLSRPAYTPLPQNHSNWGATTYVTTDALDKRRASSSPKRKDRMSAKDIYPINEKIMKKKGKNSFEMSILTYVPGKGMVKSDKGNGYFYHTTKRNASVSETLSSTTSTYSLTSKTDSPRKKQLLHKPKANHLSSYSSSSRSNDSNSSSSGSSSSSSSSSSSLPSSVILAENMNIWKCRSQTTLNSFSSSGITETITLDEPDVRRPSRTQSSEYVRCPTCHQRTNVMIRRQ
ncbi:unnamed protein product [Hydatigera taeniaeformis]|uniref:DUF5734 domain-containing protein n=1 Tax=Hydatigena taeniaeformis TaxID=6205 RepID=A0A0R3X9L0_HYDTA|nr:unnamed protein product [Hydatigera taeniaeformis]